MEAKRVLKDEGTILVAYTMNEYSVLVYGFRENHIQECLENGKLDANYRVCPSPEDLYDYVRLEDIDSYNEAAGMERIQIISADGPSDYMRQVLNTMDEKTFQTFIDYHLTTCERPELVGAGSHTVDIIRKKKDGGIENESRTNEKGGLSDSEFCPFSGSGGSDACRKSIPLCNENGGCILSGNGEK